MISLNKDYFTKSTFVGQKLYFTRKTEKWKMILFNRIYIIFILSPFIFFLLHKRVKEPPVTEISLTFCHLWRQISLDTENLVLSFEKGCWKSHQSFPTTVLNSLYTSLNMITLWKCLRLILLFLDLIYNTLWNHWVDEEMVHLKLEKNKCLPSAQLII